MKRIGKIIFLAGIFLFLFFIISSVTLARENITSWYIKDFQSEIVVNADSTLDIAEKITADCGNLQGKHGIFRILPEQINITDGTKIKTPVELVSVTDFSGRNLNFSESRSSSQKTVTWKIGDPNETVQGVNEYEIRYKVKNAIRFSDSNFDEFYWNLSGNFWDLEIDNFHAKIIFPERVNDKNSTVDYYTGSVGSKSKDLAQYFWSAPNVLEFQSTGVLEIGQGITASVIFPKNIFIPYEPGFWENYGALFFFIIPITVFFLCFFIWRKYGKDPKVDKTIIPEYEVPGNLSPMELGSLMKNGTISNSYITAEIINLAVKGALTIKETNEKILFLNSKDYELTRTGNTEVELNLNSVQKIILENIFASGNIVKLSSLKDKFYKVLKEIKDGVVNNLKEKNLIVVSGRYWQIGFLVVGIFAIFIFVIISMEISIFFAFSVILSGIILIIFSLIMPKRTPEGAELNWKAKGFKLFMETVDKDRAKFYEKESIFEKFLPYAIVFGITEIWIKRMKEIYGEEYFRNYAPVWYVGSLGSFNADSFASSMENLSSVISSSTSSPSGSGGGGFSGGGGGGGGGGGW